MIVRYEGGMKFSAESRGHKVTTDLPGDLGGTDSAMMPPELLAASLGTCIGVYVAGYLKKVDIPPDGLTVEVDYDKTQDPVRIGRISAKVTIPDGVPEERRAAVRKVAEQCMIHNTLCNLPEVELVLS